MYSKAKDLNCPKCRSLDRVYMASSRRKKLRLPRQSVHETLTIPFGAFMLVYLLASLQLLAGSFQDYLNSWPSALSAMNNLLPKPLLFAAVGAVVILLGLDRSTRAFLLHLWRAAKLDSQLYEEPDVGAPSIALGAVPVGIVSFGWAGFLGFKSLDSWVAMAAARSLSGPDWAPLAVQGFLAGGLVTIAGLPLMALVMTRVAHLFTEYGAPERDEASFRNFARNLAYPYGLLPIGMGLAMASGVQLLFAPAVFWFLAAIFMAARHTVKQNTELALPVTFLGTLPVILAFFFVSLQVQMNVVNSDWYSLRRGASTLPDMESSWLVGIVTIAGLLALPALLAAARTRRKDALANLAWQQAVVPWRELLYCERCNGVHLPNQKEFVPASEVSKLLPGGGNGG